MLLEILDEEPEFLGRELGGIALSPVKELVDDVRQFGLEARLLRTQSCSLLVGLLLRGGSSIILFLLLDLLVGVVQSADDVELAF